MPRDRLGRPPLPIDERRGQSVKLSLTDAEFEELIAEARSRGLSPAIFARDLVLRGLRRLRPRRKR